MAFLNELWLPIVLSGVFVFVASSVIHMALPIHKGDLGKLPREDEVLAGLRQAAIPPGEYMFPCPSSMKDAGSPPMLEKYNQGPVGLLTVLPKGPPAMGRSLMQWFVYTLVVSLFVAYVTRLALAPGAEYLKVFQIAGASAFLAYGTSNVSNSIWKGSSWSTTAKFVFDGLVYSLVTAGTFAWQWPGLGLTG